MEKLKHEENSILNFKSENPGAVQHGNFINYYQFHPPENRLNLIPLDIFDKSRPIVALDIGCNAGDLTISLCNLLEKNGLDCRILGIDIDPILISRANDKNKNPHINFKCVDFMQEASRTAALEEYLQRLDIQEFNVISDSKMPSENIIEDSDISSNIKTNTNNLMASTAKCPLKFSAVFCFSITMWIHLNNGDDGLRTFIQKVCDIGDTLVIEPQPWKCYKTAVSRMKKSNFQFPLFKELKIKKDVESEVEKIVLESEVFSKVYETERTKWERKLLFFKRCSI